MKKNLSLSDLEAEGNFTTDGFASDNFATDDAVVCSNIGNLLTLIAYLNIFR